MTGFIQGHCWPGEVQQHYFSLLQKCQGNSASLRYHKAGDLWRPAQMDENDRQGKQTVMQAGILWPLIFSFKISLDKMWHFCIVLVFPCYYYIICQTCQKVSYNSTLFTRTVAKQFLEFCHASGTKAQSQSSHASCDIHPPGFFNLTSYGSSCIS